MNYRGSIGAIALVAVVGATSIGAQAHDESRYPDWKGAWSRIGAPRWDTSKPEWAQEPPLTAEYEALYRANVADIDAGGQGADPTYICLAPGMPRSMIVYHPMEIVITQDATFVLIDHIHDSRRIYTDGRDWRDCERRAEKRRCRRARGYSRQSRLHLHHHRPGLTHTLHMHHKKFGKKNCKS